MKGHRTDWEDGYEGAHNGRETAMNGHRTDWEHDDEGTQNGLGRRL